jgi:hypothetical protein
LYTIYIYIHIRTYISLDLPKGPVYPARSARIFVQLVEIR